MVLTGPYSLDVTCMIHSLTNRYCLTSKGQRRERQSDFSVELYSSNGASRSPSLVPITTPFPISPPLSYCTGDIELEVLLTDDNTMFLDPSVLELHSESKSTSFLYRLGIGDGRVSFTCRPALKQFITSPNRLQTVFSVMYSHGWVSQLRLQAFKVSL